MQHASLVMTGISSVDPFNYLTFTQSIHLIIKKVCILPSFLLSLLSPLSIFLLSLPPSKASTLATFFCGKGTQSYFQLFILAHCSKGFKEMKMNLSSQPHIHTPNLKPSSHQQPILFGFPSHSSRFPFWGKARLNLFFE